LDYIATVIYSQQKIKKILQQILPGNCLKKSTLGPGGKKRVHAKYKGSRL